MEAYGVILHPETGEAIASVKDGKLIGATGEVYRIDGDRILSEDGKVRGYLSVFAGQASRSTDLANRLFGRKSG
ncbi:hypothetical protein TSA1_08210 [Bradyrhizobium nitroreducens]|uniref:Uncharacterized protein n=1 Tax=Bradyrhizobium nitroreducens TaxID=709803 RepID=A0A2M6U843_9BRAD|nr:hypothetical protein [Bradyrhizobium nitroreducens]PIT00759.1 hypothetical protein TSA1_08210 [Bradyrhizobium nitroreducens]